MFFLNWGFVLDDTTNIQQWEYNMSSKTQELDSLSSKLYFWKYAFKDYFHLTKDNKLQKPNDKFYLWKAQKRIAGDVRGWLIWWLVDLNVDLGVGGWVEVTTAIGLFYRWEHTLLISLVTPV